MSIFERLREQFEAQAAKPAFIVPGGRDLTFRDLDLRSARMAAVLDDLGLPAGAVVAVQTDKGADVMALYLAVLRSGRVFLPLNSTYMPDEVAYHLADSAALLLVGQPARSPEMRPVALAAGAAFLTLGATETGSLQIRCGTKPPSNGPWGPPPVDSPAVLLYTSGTTGKPKGALLSHGNVVAMIDSLVEAWAWSSGDVLLHALPLFHIHGLVVASTAALAAGATTILLPRFDLDDVLGWFPKSTVFMGVPTMYHRLANDARLSADICQGIRLFVSGSAPLSVPDFERFEQRTGHPILERYGMTETGMITSNPWAGARKPGTVGSPLPGVEVHLADPETLAEPSRGDVGEIWVRGPSVFSGYLNRPEANRESFVDGWFRTGDLACQDEDGYYAIVGRARDIVITGGLNVYPAEVENVLSAVPGVEECAVIGLPDPDFGERVTAVVVRAAGTVDAGAIIAEARKHLAPYKCPHSVEFVDVLPRNAMGKVDKEQLRRNFAGS